jgi:hypothetical protein
VPRECPEQVKSAIVQERGLVTIHTLKEMVAEWKWARKALIQNKFSN